MYWEYLFLFVCVFSCRYEKMNAAKDWARTSVYTWHDITTFGLN